MARFGDVATLARQLAGEAGRLNKRAAIAAALVRLAGAPLPEQSSSPQAIALPPALADAGLFCLYLAGQPFPEADPRKLNAGGALLTRVLKEVSGCTDAALATAYRRHGDLGAAAGDLLAPPYGRASAESTLTLDEISQAFDVMAGARSTAVRAAAVEHLLRRATSVEAMYLLKLMLGDMRIGVKQSLIEEAIAVAAGAELAAVRHAVMLEADLARVAAMTFSGSLATARMRLFHPLGFMLASPVETPEEAVERFTQKPVKLEHPKPEKPSRRKQSPGILDAPEAVLAVDSAEQGYADDVEMAAAADTSVLAHLPQQAPVQASIQEAIEASLPVQAFLEDKYDGMRAQVHCAAGSEYGEPPARVAIYSRNREDITQSFPEIEEAFRSAAAAGMVSLILDGELLGWDFAEQKALPFSSLGQRIGRKRVDNQMRQQIPVVFMAFDLLFEDGELLLPQPLRERRARLELLAGQLQPATMAPLKLEERPHGAQHSLFAAAPEPAEQPLQRLMLSPATLVESAAAIDKAYADARARANEGVMLKAAGSAYLPGRRGLAWVKLKRELATLDVVITGAEFGHGKRAGLLSDYTFAVRGPAREGQPGELLNVGKAYSGVTDAEIAELTEWLQFHTLEDYGHFRTVEPLRVLEVAFNNVMRSGRHSSGFALRFPRILRLRDDKPPEEIDTLQRVEEIYQSQPDKGAE